MARVPLVLSGLLLMVAASGAGAEALLRDDFEGAALDPTRWIVPTGLGAFHVYRIRWLPDRVQWFVDGALVREESDGVPDDPLHVRLNLWAPDAFFVEAYAAALQPAATPEQNEVYFAEVDWVEIRRPALAPGLLLPGASFRGRPGARRRRRRRSPTRPPHW